MELFRSAISSELLGRAMIQRIDRQPKAEEEELQRLQTVLLRIDNTILGWGFPNTLPMVWHETIKEPCRFPPMPLFTSI